MKVLIIQTSPFHTASTFLINAIYGMIPELSSKRIIGTWNTNFQDYFEGDIICLKCHNTNLNELTKIYKKNYTLLYVCSERQELNLKIEEKYKKYANTIVFEFNELNETITNPLTAIVDNIHDKMRKLLNDLAMLNVALNKDTCIERLNKMNARYEEIKNEPFSYIDDFYEIHGSHRNRKS
jgi:hypothetical protein